MYLQIDRWSKNIAAIDDKGNEYSYGDVHDFVVSFRDWIPDRSLIFILCRNNFATLAAHVACIENHVVPLMISADMDEGLLKNLISAYSPEYIWLPEEMVNSGKIVVHKYDYALVKHSDKKVLMHDDLAMLLTTSGSTGSPKLVRHSYDNLYLNAKHVAEVFGFNEDDKALVDLKLHYTMGLNVACSNLYSGATLILTEHNPSEKEWWKVFDEYHPTNMCGVPYSYEILKAMRFFRKEHEGLRIIAQGGGKLTDELFETLAEYASDHEISFYATFGTSETTARLAYLPPELAKDKTGSIGKAIPGGELFLVDENGKIIIDNVAEGEMVYKGPNVTLGYAYTIDDLSKGDERKGMYFTGDIARRDSDGFYYILGRKGRFLKLFGYRVGLDECENLLKMNYNSEFACAGTDNQLVVYHTADISDKDIKLFLSKKTGIQISAFASEKIDAIPRNENGKIKYAELHKLIG